MSEETREPQGPINPDDIRQPGPGGGEQPATMLDTGRPVPQFSGTPEGRDNRFDDIPDAPTAAPDLAESEEKERVDVLYVPLEKISVAEMRENSQSYYKDDSLYVLDEGTELFNQSGARILLRSPAVVRLVNATGDPHANDTKFAGFLHDSEKNWALNIGQLERPFNRATATPLPLMCAKHGEDLEHAPYGEPRQCPKCAVEALEKARFEAQIDDINKQLAEENAARNATTDRPDGGVKPIKVGDFVKRTDDLTDDKVYLVLSIEFGIVNCRFPPEAKEGDQTTERLFSLGVLRPLSQMEIELHESAKSAMARLDQR